MKELRFLALGGLLLLAACSTPQPPNGPPSGDAGSIRGDLATIEPSAAASEGWTSLSAREVAPDLEVTVTPMSGGDLDSLPSLVPGELIVSFAPASGVVTQALSSVRVAGTEFAAVRALSLDGTVLYRAEGLDEAATLARARLLEARSDVLYASPNYLEYAATIPDDTFYPLQWHLPAIRMPETWDITTGTAVNVAVVDTGILYIEGRSDLVHPDLFGKAIPGFDFVSDIREAGDGDARDFDASDPGSESLHGSHVAGTIASATNNGRGVAGVNWAANLQAIRVLGVNGSGTLIDIMEGALWASGGRIPGLPMNPTPAQVINISLGGKHPCSPYQQNIFDEIAANGSIVVVAAGNENDDANRYAPASCTGVITVGATDAVNDRSPYSNYGPRIDIMAPGGDTSVDRNNDGKVDGVLSLGFDRTRGEFTYTFLQGTSMAAPHVAGVISLMKGLKPDLTTAEALAIMRNTAVPLNPAACKRATGKDCGAGLLDAFSAMRAVGQSSPPASAGGALSFNPDPVEFGAAASSLPLELINTGSTAVSYAVSQFQASPSNPGDILDDALSGDALSGTVPAGGTRTLTLGLDRTKVSADGNYAFEYIFTVNGQEQRLLARFSRGVATGRPSGSTIVASFLIENDDLVLDPNGDPVLGGGASYDDFVTTYDFEAVPGEHFVVSWVDANGNVEVDEGDYIGFYPENVTVDPRKTTSGIDMSVGFVFQIGSHTADDAPLREVAAGLERLLAR